MILAACANDKFTNATDGIGCSMRVLRGEALIVVVVSTDNYVRIGFVKRLPERFHCQIVAVRIPRTEERLVPIGKGAGGGMRGKISAQPFFLGRAGFAAADILAFTVQHDDVPRS